MIDEYKYLMLVSFLIVVSCFESFNYGQKLVNVSFVSSLGRNHFLQIVGYLVPLAQTI